ncbi:MAG: hypothetical protein BM555_00670 [Crocinitomix sp. MedPE-SWsnd]|nr:MAG: hypothetical protein BM555_00670 [Crocinitomix sp. MedPE-SWsnd]
MKVYVLLLALLWGGFSYSQELDTLEDCKKYKSLYYQYLRQGMYEDARTFWVKARETCALCDQLDYKLFKNGRVIYLQLYKKIEKIDTLSLNANMDTVNWIYEEGREYVEADMWGYDYASFLMGREQYSKAELVDTLMRPMILGGELPRPSTIELYNRWLLSKKRTGKIEGHFGVSDDEALSVYCELSKICHKGMESSEDSTDYWGVDMRMKVNLMKYAPKNALALEQILDLHEEYSQNKTVLKSQLERNRDLLEACGQIESDLYSRVLLKMLEEFPNAYGYSDYAATNYRLGRFGIAIEYYEKALENTQDTSVIDIWIFKLAMSYYGAKEYKKAFKYAKLVEGKNRASAMKICGDCIAVTANVCGNSTFERKANYWLANDYYKKAKALGIDVSTAKYLNMAPTVGEVFDQGLNMGDSIHLDCWNERSVIR